MSDVKAELERRLAAAFAPARLEVIDESELHRGHAGYRPGGNTHVRVVLRAASLAGLDRVTQQRRVYAAVGDLMAAPIHALALDVKPDDA